MPSIPGIARSQMTASKLTSVSSNVAAAGPFVTTWISACSRMSARSVSARRRSSSTISTLFRPAPSTSTLSPPFTVHPPPTAHQRAPTRAAPPVGVSPGSRRVFPFGRRARLRTKTDASGAPARPMRGEGRCRKMSMRVLIVDDSRTARLMLRRALPQALGREVVEAASGSEALARIAAEPIDVMFLDLTMSGLDGYQVLKALKEAGRLPLTIVVSADVQPLAQQRVRALGAMAFVPKNISGTDLTSVVETAGLL